MNYLRSICRRSNAAVQARGSRLLACCSGLLAGAWRALRAARPSIPSDVFTPGARDVRRGGARTSSRSGRSAEQPIEFPHNTHIAQEGGPAPTATRASTKGPVAGLPSVKTCMICHSAIATDRPRIQQITAMRDKGIEISRGSASTASRARRTCASTTRRTSAPASTARPATATSASRRSPSATSTHNMGFCVNCHTREEGVERLPDVSLLMPMDRRSFIKLTAVTGTSATLASCGNPENQLIRFVPDEDIVPGIAEWKPSVCPLCAAGCGADRARDGRRRRDRRATARPASSRWRVAKKLEGSPQHPDQPRRAVRARPGGDSGHLSPRSHHAAAEAHRRARRRRVRGRSPGTRRSPS